MPLNERFRHALETVRVTAREAAAAGELPEFLGALEAVRVEALLDAMKPAFVAEAPEADRVLTPAQAARMLGRSRWWVYRHRHSLPMVRFPIGGYGFSERERSAGSGVGPAARK